MAVRGFGRCQTCECTLTDENEATGGCHRSTEGSDDREVPGRSVGGAVWQAGTPGHRVIKPSGWQGAPPAQEAALGRPDASNHGLSVSEHRSAAGHVSRISLAWIDPPAGDTSGFGRVMLQRISAGSVSKPIDPTALAGAANDNNATWVTDASGAGALGCEPAVSGLSTGDTLVTWIDTDGHAHGRLYASAEPSTASPVGDGSDDPAYAAINAALGDLGPAGAASEGGRRLQVAELRPGTFAVMWLALGESGPLLRGSLFLHPTGAEGSDHRGGWTEHPIPDVRLPHSFTGRFTMAPAGSQGAGLEVTYSGATGSTTVEIFGDVGRFLGEGHLDDLLGAGHAGQSGQLGLVGRPAVADGSENTGAHVASKHGTGGDWNLSPSESAAETSALHNHGEPAQTAVAIATTPGVNETAPIVQAVQDGFAVAWQIPADADAALQIKLALYDENGLPSGAEVLVTDNAAADVAPAISGLGDGVAAAYVHADDGALVVGAYASDGTQIGQQTVVDPGDTNAIVEIAVGSNGNEFAVVYVQQGSDAGEGAASYGNIMLQRYATTTEGGLSQLVELGRDGEHGGSDSAVHLTAGGNQAAPTPAVGRAPAVMGMNDGGLAIVWVESVGARETIKGSVLDRGGGQALRIDLAALLESDGIARGTKPALLQIGDGDFLITWLQPDGDDGGYVVMSALYSETSPGTWVAPERAVRLKTFDDAPEDHVVAVSSDDDGVFINVIWREDSSSPGGGDTVYSERYEIDGQRVGGTVKVAQSDASIDDRQPASNTLAATGLLDGHVVVYTKHGPDGDLDVAAQVIDTDAVETTHSGGETSNAIDLVGDRTFSTGVDEETAINPLADEIGTGLTISRINDVPITTVTPVDVGSGWVQLREDGWLTVAPDAGYTGQIDFDYMVTGTATGVDSKGRVVVNVEPRKAAAAVTLFNQVSALPGDVSPPANLKVADIAVADGALGTDGLSLTGLDAGMFEIVGNALYLKEGVELDFGAKPTLSIEILASPGEFDRAASFTLSVEDPSETRALRGTGDNFVFAPGYGEARGDLSDPRDARYATFQELVDSGALVQTGDVEIPPNPDDPADLHKIILRDVELSALSDADFKFS